MGFTKIEEADLKNKGVIGLPDAPDLSTAELQRKFDELVLDVVVPKINNLIAELEAMTASASIGIDVEDGLSANKNVQDAFTRLHLIVKSLEKVSHSHENMDILNSISTEVLEELEKLETLTAELEGLSEDVNDTLKECNDTLDDCKRQLEAVTYVPSENITFTDEMSQWTNGQNVLVEWGTVNRVKFINDKFYAVTDTGYILVSDYGLEWNILYNSEDLGNIKDIIYEKDMYIIVSYNKGIFYSADAVTWTNASTKTGALKIVYGNDLFVILYNIKSIGKSSDGINWEVINVTTGFTNLYDIDFDDDTFYIIDALEKINTSSDCTTWTSYACVSGNYVIKVGSNIYVISNNGSIFNIFGVSSAQLNTTTNNFILKKQSNGLIDDVFVDNDNFIHVIMRDGTCIKMNSDLSNVYSIKNMEFSGTKKHCLVLGKERVLISSDIFYTLGLKKEIEQYVYSTILIRKMLMKGKTEIVFYDDRIDENSILTFYTSIYSVNPSGVSVVAGSVTLTFETQETDMEVGVRVDG